MGGFMVITKEEIDDKSKADAISKGLVVLQTSWFLIQCIARGVQGLAVTELELVTVAFATLNFVMYFLWRHKPLNVQRGVRMTFRHPFIMDNQMGQDLSLVDTSNDPFDRVLYKLLLLIFGGHDEHNDVKRVPTFYPDKWVTSRRRFAVFIVIAVVLAFGGIHCVGWSFTFPSHAERILWRVASVLIIVIPIYSLMVQFGFDEPFTDRLMIALMCNLILARLVLLVLPLLSLRSLPPLAYHVVHWTSSIPHI
ncbi:hypothetical protein F5148DRAFT_1337196 [Russula earlei]|uniref:Uncharacterized protein n=1 Tax=Russula earlei TaxID=71964 RepID=A0ACC0TVN3_9AGAM|nr:hypothetical protein F5148DRAFT_1337196 [Russula earlei]